MSQTVDSERNRYLYAVNIINDWFNYHGLKSLSVDLSKHNKVGFVINDHYVLSFSELNNIFSSATLNREVKVDALDNIGRFNEKKIMWDISMPWIDNKLHELALKLYSDFDLNKCNRFQVIISHDVDRTTAFEPTAVMNALLKILGKRKLPCLGLRTSFTPSSLARNVERVLDYEVSNGVGAIYFMLAGPYGIHRYSSRTDINWLVSRQIVQLVKNAGMKIGLHGSFSARELNSYSQEKKKIEDVLGLPIETHRNHYLRFDTEKLPSQLDNAGIKYDFSVGFTSRMGFRGGYAHACRAYNSIDNKPSGVISIPLLFMDSIMLGKDPSNIYSELRSSLEDVKRVNGCVSILFHPEMFLVDFRFFNLFKNVIELCKELGADLSGNLPRNKQNDLLDDKVIY